MIRSRAKLAYESVRRRPICRRGSPSSRDRIAAAEDARGAARVDPPEQEVDAAGGGGYDLAFRPMLKPSSATPRCRSATNLAVADALQAHHTGLFRVMAAPDAGAVGGCATPRPRSGSTGPSASLDQFERTLDPDRPEQAAFMLAIRRAGRGASYVPYRDGVVPWHAAMAATYAHATAPLRRLADRYVVMATLAIANGAAGARRRDATRSRSCPPVMARADALAGRIDRAVIDLAEAVLLDGQEGRDVRRGGHRPRRARRADAADATCRSSCG